MQTEILRAYRFALDPTKAQQEALARHAGAARWAYNHALAAKVAAHSEWRTQVDTAVQRGAEEREARKNVRVRIPNFMDITRAWRLTRDLPEDEGGAPWYSELNSYSIVSGFRDADAAWKNWLDSLHGKRAGRRVGYPQFKKKGRRRESFRLHHDTKKPTIRLVGYRRIRLPRVGEVRLHGSGRELARAVNDGRAVIQSATLTQAGHRWYASVLCRVSFDLPEGPSRRQRRRGRVGVDLGVKHLATLSEPLGDSEATQFIPNPRHLRAARQRLVKSERALSRKTPGSRRHYKARVRLARLHHQVALRRATSLHQLTKILASNFSEIAVETLDLSSLTRSARGSISKPGRRVRWKASLNRAILDSGLGQLRLQLAYKTRWYGSKLAAVDRCFPSSKICSNCGWRNPSLTLRDRTFDCTNCETSMDRDINAARNIARHAVLIEEPVARDRQETEDKNARGALVRPTALRDGRQGATKREDIDSPSMPPQRSDPLTPQPLKPEQQALF